jgi:glycerol-3-phosphate O-acyltransferase
MRLQGGKLLWIAPSGGRDRPNADGVWMPAEFDVAAVDLMRTMLAQAKRPGHLFPLAMHSGEMMPPPSALEKGLGERRLTFFVGVGASPLPLSYSKIPFEAHWKDPASINIAL